MARRAPAVHPLLLAAMFAVATFALPQLASATSYWPNDVTSTGLDLYLSYNYGTRPVQCSDLQGGFWVGSPGGNGTYDFGLRHVSAGGLMLGSATGVYTGYAKTALSIVPDGAGGVYAVWQDARGNGDIYAQRYNSGGTALWAGAGVPICTNAAAQTDPVAVRTAAGYVIIGWTDWRGGDADIYAQFLYLDGTCLWTANGVAVAAVAGSSQTGLAMVADNNGGAYFAWQDTRNNATTGVDIYARELNSAGAGAWTSYPTGAPVASVAGNAGTPRLCINGIGLFVVWDEDRGLGTGSDIYAQSLVSFGGGPILASTGVVVCNAAGAQVNPVVAPDGMGGVIVVWEDSRSSATTGTDLYAQRIGAGGVMQWSANGIAVTTAIDAQNDPQIVSDGQNGAVVVWTDNRTGFNDIYARRILSSGSASWTYNGVPVNDADWQQNIPSVLSDGSGGAFITFMDNHTPRYPGVYYGYFAQHIDRFGMIGTPAPTIAGVRDVANDQGGFVRVSWSASYLDAMPSNRVDEYWLWRQAPAAAAAQAIARRDSGRMLRAVSSATGVTYWERVAVTPANALAGYSVVTATTSDSIGGSNQRTQFMVEAHQLNTEYYWSSDPDSGYSVDNLPPSTPAPFAATYGAGTTRLTWNPNHEADLAGYQLYRGTSPGFTPSPANLLASKPDTGYVDVAGAPYVYKLVAVDAHGNLSPVAAVVPNGTLAVPASSSTAVRFLAPPSPNPVRDGTTLRFGLARDGAAALTVYDAAGRLVRTVVAGVLPAGDHSVRWDVRDAGGRSVAPGLYLARLEAAGESPVTRRLVVIR